mgnify:FL=1
MIRIGDLVGFYCKHNRKYAMGIVIEDTKYPYGRWTVVSVDDGDYIPLDTTEITVINNKVVADQWDKKIKMGKILDKLGKDS